MRGGGVRAGETAAHRGAANDRAADDRAADDRAVTNQPSHYARAHRTGSPWTLPPGTGRRCGGPAGPVGAAWWTGVGGRAHGAVPRGPVPGTAAPMTGTPAFGVGTRFLDGRGASGRARSTWECWARRASAAARVRDTRPPPRNPQAPRLGLGFCHGGRRRGPRAGWRLVVCVRRRQKVGWREPRFAAPGTAHPPPHSPPPPPTRPQSFSRFFATAACGTGSQTGLKKKTRQGVVHEGPPTRRASLTSQGCAATEGPARLLDYRKW